jgi:hypothetical protein
VSVVDVEGTSVCAGSRAKTSARAEVLLRLLLRSSTTSVPGWNHPKSMPRCRRRSDRLQACPAGFLHGAGVGNMGILPGWTCELEEV